jgi:tRNA-specific 2-thiouridylase
VPLYVLGKDAKTNTLIVGPQDELGSTELLVDDINWIAGQPRTEPFRAEVKIRYTAREAGAEVAPLEGGKQARVRFEAPQRDITPGQAAVFYDGEVVLGGGLIVSE